jgi:hypothetical protein
MADFLTETLVYMGEHGWRVIEVPQAKEDEFMELVAELAPKSMFSEQLSHYYGANIVGKPRTFLLNPAGRISCERP